MNQSIKWFLCSIFMIFKILFEPRSGPVHSLDLFPGVCGQMKNPQVFVVVELFPVRRRKLPSEHPQLPPSLRNYHRLRRERGGTGGGGERGKVDREEREREKQTESLYTICLGNLCNQFMVIDALCRHLSMQCLTPGGQM